VVEIRPEKSHYLMTLILWNAYDYYSWMVNGNTLKRLKPKCASEQSSIPIVKRGEDDWMQ